MTSILLVVALMVAALALGELIYRHQRGAARFWGDFSQALYATGALIIVVILAFGGGAYTLVAFVFAILYFAVARTKWGDVRRTLNG